MMDPYVKLLYWMHFDSYVTIPGDAAGALGMVVSDTQTRLGTNEIPGRDALLKTIFMTLKARGTK